MLDGFAAKHPGRFKVWYTLDRPPPAGTLTLTLTLTLT